MHQAGLRVTMAALPDIAPADAERGSWLRRNSSGRRARRMISTLLSILRAKSRRALTARHLVEHRISYVSRMYELMNAGWRGR